MEEIVIDITLPIVPNQGLGGIELRRNIGEYEGIHYNGKEIHLFSWLQGEDYRLDGFNAWYTFRHFSLQSGIDVRTGQIFQIRATRGYRGTLWGNVSIGMKVEEAFSFVPALDYDEIAEAIFCQGQDGVALGFGRDEHDPSVEIVPSLTIETISVFALDVHWYVT